MSSPHPSRDPHLDGMDTRAMVRHIANDMIAHQDFPSAERVRKRIQADTGGNVNPSTLTVQDEMRKWLSDTFWAKHNALGALPDNPQVSHSLKRLYQDGFQTLVVGAISSAAQAWNKEREEFVVERQEAATIQERLQAQVTLLQADLDRAEDKLIGASEDNSHALEEIAQLNERLAVATQDIKEALQAQAEHERALNAVRESERGHTEEQIKLARADATRVLLDLDERRQDVKRLSAELVKAQAAGSAATERAFRSEALQETAVAEIASIKSEQRLKNIQITELEGLVVKLRETQMHDAAKKVVIGTAREPMPRRQLRKNVSRKTAIR